MRLSPTNRPSFAEWLQGAAQAAGALNAACLKPNSLGSADLRAHFDAWIEAGNRGALPYVEDSAAARCAPFAALPWARCALVVTFRGDWGRIAAVPLFPAPAPGRPAGYVSLYACGTDYHRAGRALLSDLAARLAAFAGRANFRHEIAVDTRPLPEVCLAVAGGLGVRGRSGLLRTSQHGSRVFIGTLFTDLDLPEVRLEPGVLGVETKTPDRLKPEPRHQPVGVQASACLGLSPLQPGISPPCAECGACVRACPTGALDTPGLLRVRPCRSWLSMEYRGALSRKQQEQLGDCLFGCDACTAACPPAAEFAGVPVDLEWLLQTPTAELRRRIRGTALEHAGPTLLKRNAAAILGRHLTGTDRALWRERILKESHSPAVRETVLNWACQCSVPEMPIHTFSDQCSSG